MQRKVAKIGPSTLMVSLPTQWVKKHGINKGDVVNVLEDGDKLTINLGTHTPTEKSATLSVEGLDVMLSRAIAGYYKKGYSEIKIVCDSHKKLADVYQALNVHWTGMEIVEQGASHILLRQVSEVTKESFPAMLNRAFLFLIATSDASCHALTSGNKESLRMVVARDPTQNKYCDFCRRVLNKESITGAPMIYYIVEQLERMGDLYRDLCKHFLEHPAKLKKHTALFQEAHALLQQFYTLYYRFTLERYETLGTSFKTLQKRIEDALSPADKQDVFFLMYLHQIAEAIFDINGAALVLNLETRKD